MKLAEVTHSCDKSNTLVKGNYRPVSLLTTLSKLYESTMDDQLFRHLVSICNTLLSAPGKVHSCGTFQNQGYLSCLAWLTQRDGLSYMASHRLVLCCAAWPGSRLVATSGCPHRYNCIDFRNQYTIHFGKACGVSLQKTCFKAIQLNFEKYTYIYNDNIKMLSELLVFCEGNPLIIGGIFTQDH